VRTFDWILLAASLIFIVLYGVIKGRGSKDIRGYLLADRSMKWYTVALSIMATQASAITFLSGPGQAYADGMRFVQFYFGLPIAMVILSITAVPVYHKLNVFTAYEYLENRFDLKIRLLTSFLFLIQRGLAAGLTIFAPSIILSVMLGWNLYWTNLIVGGLVIIYTASGGTRAVNKTHFYQMLIIMFGMLAAFFVAVRLLPPDISVLDATYVAGKLGRLNTIDLSFDLQNRYNIWSGIIGGLFLQLSYFGTDQSQVQRYLTGSSVGQSRMGLIFNGFVKIPMQFFILFIGVIVFAFYQFQIPPLFFNSDVVRELQDSPAASRYEELEASQKAIHERKQSAIRAYLDARRSDDRELIDQKGDALLAAQNQYEEVRNNVRTLVTSNDPAADPSDTNYIFLTFVINFLPAGLVGLVIAAILAASMSSTSGELNALASTTVVDFYKRIITKQSSDRKEVLISRLATIGWGMYAIVLAQYASRLGSLIEAVNILGSLFYGTILGIFLVAFYMKRIHGSAVFIAAIIAEAAVIATFLFTDVTFLWYNVVGCMGVLILAPVFEMLSRRQWAVGRRQ
jgi:SSS family solute:Na+ symporter